MNSGSVNGYGETFWKITVPDEHCQPGLEISIVTSRTGVHVGYDVIPWEEIDKARKIAMEAE